MHKRSLGWVLVATLWVGGVVLWGACGPVVAEETSPAPAADKPPAAASEKVPAPAADKPPEPQPPTPPKEPPPKVSAQEAVAIERVEKQIASIRDKDLVQWMAGMLEKLKEFRVELQLLKAYAAANPTDTSYAQKIEELEKKYGGATVGPASTQGGAGKSPPRRLPRTVGSRNELRGSRRSGSRLILESGRPFAANGEVYDRRAPPLSGLPRWAGSSWELRRGSPPGPTSLPQERLSRPGPC